MSVEVVKMNGAELKKLRERADIAEADMPKRLKCSPGSYYNYIREPEKEIPAKVEAAIDADQELVRIKNEILSGISQKDLVTVAIQQQGDLVASMKKLLEVVSTILVKQDNNAEDLKKDKEILIRNNDAVIKNNDALLEFLNLAKKEGEFVYQKKSA